MDVPYFPVAIVGAGQAGLSLSRELSDRGIEHIVFERDRVGHACRNDRWDTFCLVTPNWQCRLPGYPYAGDDPDGFMARDEIVAYLQGFAASFSPPLREGVAVRDVRPGTGGTFELETSGGACRAEAVVAAVGGYHTPIVPAFARFLPERLLQLHSQHYRNPGQLPPGEVLVVGTGQSGAQIAEDLHLAGRRVRLCVGDAPRVARRYRGRDVVAWLDDMGYYEMPVQEHPLGTRVRENTNHCVTGRAGGHDLDLRAFARDGMPLQGRLLDFSAGRFRFDDDLTRNLDRADAVSEGIKDAIDRHIAATGVAAPGEARYAPVWHPATEQRELALDATDIGSVVVHRLPDGLLVAPAPGLRQARRPGARAWRHGDRGRLLPRPAVAAYMGLGTLLGCRGRRGVPRRSDRRLGGRQAARAGGRRRLSRRAA